MPSQLDDPELIDRRSPPAPEPPRFPDPEFEHGVHRLAPGRGIIHGIIMAVPIWSLLAFTAYMLV